MLRLILGRKEPRKCKSCTCMKKGPMWLQTETARLGHAGTVSGKQRCFRCGVLLYISKSQIIQRPRAGKMCDKSGILQWGMSQFISVPCQWPKAVMEKCAGKAVFEKNSALGPLRVRGLDRGLPKQYLLIERNRSHSAKIISHRRAQNQLKQFETWIILPQSICLKGWWTFPVWSLIAPNCYGSRLSDRICVSASKRPAAACGYEQITHARVHPTRKNPPSQAIALPASA